jgi:hypothetical protein
MPPEINTKLAMQLEVDNEGEAEIIDSSVHASSFEFLPAIGRYLSRCLHPRIKYT